MKTKTKRTRYYHMLHNGTVVGEACTDDAKELRSNIPPGIVLKQVTKKQYNVVLERYSKAAH